MRTAIFQLSVYLCLGGTCTTLSAQVVKQNANQQIYVDPLVYPNIIQHTNAPIPASSSASPTPGGRIMWIEYGDGGFTNDNFTARSLSTTNPDNWFFLTSKLYDTVWSQVRVAAGASNQFTRQGRTNPSDNDVNLITTPKGVLVTPNAMDIVNNDTMSFAVTYKLKPKPARSYYLIFNYNTNIFFHMANDLNPLDPSNGMMVTGQNIKFGRTFHNESFVATTSVTANGIPPSQVANLVAYLNAQVNSGSSFTNYVILKVPYTSLADSAEKNVFYSLISKSAIREGGSTSVNATLVEKDTANNFTVVGNHTIGDMMVRPSHDPNYIAQSPVCLALPKTARNFTYHLHFQNTGPGNADSAKITIQLTPGFDLNTFTIVQGRFSGENYYGANLQHPGISVTADPLTNKMTLTMDLSGMRGLNNPLLGTNDAVNPYTNQQTMGDIYFTLQSTAAVPYYITAQAFIRFHSAATNVWELPVPTNTAVSGYSDCCNCDILDCGKPEGRLIRTVEYK